MKYLLKRSLSLKAHCCIKTFKQCKKTDPGRSNPSNQNKVVNRNVVITEIKKLHLCMVTILKYLYTPTHVF